MSTTFALCAAIRRMISAGGFLSLAILGATAADWPQYRGPNHDGVSTDRILKQWPAQGPTEVWRVSCTNGLSSFAVSGGRAFTQIRRKTSGGDQEVCVALNANTGAELWAKTLGVTTYDGSVGSDDGPRSTPSVQNGRVFVLSSSLVLYCLNATNGAGIWTNDLRASYNGSLISWQNAASPLLDNDLIFINCNASSQSLLALRAANGSLEWRSQNEPMTHSTPVIATIQGLPQVVFATQKGLVSLNRTNGALLWKAPYPFTYSTSLAASPVVHSNIVFISGAAGYGMGSFAARIALSNSVYVPTPLWTNRTSSYGSQWMTPVCSQGFLYGMFGSSSTSPLMCIDLQTGALRWSVSGFGRGGTILVDNNVLTLTEMGDLVLVQTNPNAYTELARWQTFPGYNSDNNKCWNVPTVCDGRIYARSTAQAVCLDVAIPPIKLLTPKVLAGNRLQLWIGTATGGAIASNRLAALEVRFNTNMATALSSWTRLTNNLVLTNGLVRVDNVDGSTLRFFTVAETP